MISRNARNVLLISAVVAAVAGVAIYRQRPQPGARPVPTSRVAALPRLLDLGADKCIACKEMAPILEELREEYDGRAIIDFIDVWKDPTAAEPFGARVIPTQIFFSRDGKEVWRHEGFLSKAEIVAKLKQLGAG